MEIMAEISVIRVCLMSCVSEIFPITSVRRYVKNCLGIVTVGSNYLFVLFDVIDAYEDID